MTVGTVQKKVQSPAPAQWRRFPPPYPISLGGLVLHQNGNFDLGPFCCNQSTTIIDTRLGDALVNKKLAGAGQELVITFDGGIEWRLKFEEGQWWGVED